jgi:putative hemolysin
MKSLLVSFASLASVSAFALAAVACSASVEPATQSSDAATSKSDGSAKDDAASLPEKDACGKLGGACVAVVPGACSSGHSVGGTDICGGVGSSCCVQNAGDGGTCTPLAPSGGSANPAGVYCAALGYSASGGICTFPDASSCDQWAFFRGECGQQFSFCNLHGGVVSNLVVTTGGQTTSRAVCAKNGKSCDDQTFAQTCVCE